MKTTKPKWMRLDWRGARPLTLRELIAKSSFLPMMDHIIDFQDKMAGQEPHFYRAYLYIKRMKVKYRPNDYILAKCMEGGPFVMVLEGNSWHELLGYPIRRAKDLHCSDTHLAAQCLWHLTFYGYTPEEQKENAERSFEREERNRREDEIFLADDLYTDDEIRKYAWSGTSRIRDEVLDRLFSPEEVAEVKAIHKAYHDAEVARWDAEEEEERIKQEQEAALKLKMKKKAEEERRHERNRRRRRREKINKNRYHGKQNRKNKN